MLRPEVLSCPHLPNKPSWLLSNVNIAIVTHLRGQQRGRACPSLPPASAVSRLSLYTSSSSQQRGERTQGTGLGPRPHSNVERFPEPLPAFIITQMHRFSLCQGHSGMPQGRNSTFLSAPHCFHPTDSCPTCFYTISRHNGVLTGGGGTSPKSHYYHYHCHYSCTGPERSVTAQASSQRSAQEHILNRKGRKEGRSSVSKHLPGHSAKYYSDTED